MIQPPGLLATLGSGHGLAGHLLNHSPARLQTHDIEGLMQAKFMVMTAASSRPVGLKATLGTGIGRPPTLSGTGMRLATFMLMAAALGTAP